MGIIWLLFAILLVTLIIIAIHDNDAGDGEPFSFALGISIWPTELIRLFAGFLSVHFLVNAWFGVQINFDEIENKFGMKRDLHPHFCAASLHEFESRRLKWIFWPGSWKLDKTAQIEPYQVWMQYTGLRSFWQRLKRGLILLILFAGLGLSVLGLYGFPITPARGFVAFVCDYICLYFSVGMLIVLASVAVDSVALSSRLVEQVTDGITQWPEPVYQRYRKMFPHLPDDALSFLVDLDFFAERSKVISRLIYYPFVICCFTIVSRLYCFDNWRWSPQLIVVIAIPLLVSLYCGWHLRQSAEAARQKAVTQLKGWQYHDPFLVPVYEKAINQIIAVKEGAFAPWWDQPIFESILIPFGGFGIVAIAEYFIATRYI